MYILNADDVLELHHQLVDLEQRKLYIPYTEFREQIDSAFDNIISAGGPDIWSATWNLLLRVGAEKPFQDGNKRTAWQSVLLLLKKNGYSLDIIMQNWFQPFPMILRFLLPGCSYARERSYFISSLRSMVVSA
ncbi:MAG: hypothetical protein IJD04_00450 [Desulfovibrionaceae bacterium]|nr:hypothetical protein [Desulfovibrionaceae bacterium]